MDNFDKFYKKALNFLSFRPRSEKELKDYLSRKKADDLSIQKIIQNLKENKFLDDKEFAIWLVEQRTTFRPRAERLIKMELKQKGIDAELIDEVFKDLVNSDLEKALSLGQKRMERYAKEKDKRKIYEKLGRFLASRGFNWDIIKEVIDRVLPKEYNK
jgi:regulatory protein